MQLLYICIYEVMNSVVCCTKINAEGLGDVVSPAVNRLESCVNKESSGKKTGAAYIAVDNKLSYAEISKLRYR